MPFNAPLRLPATHESLDTLIGNSKDVEAYLSLDRFRKSLGIPTIIDWDSYYLQRLNELPDDGSGRQPMSDRVFVDDKPIHLEKEVRRGRRQR